MAGREHARDRPDAGSTSASARMQAPPLVSDWTPAFLPTGFGLERMFAQPGAGSVRPFTSTALGLQRAVGNAVVAAMLSPRPTVVQRDGEAQAGQGSTGGAASGATPEFDHKMDPVTVDGSSAVEFADNVRTRVGGAHCAITLDPIVNETWKERANGKEIPGTRVIESVGLKVSTKITTVRFGMGRPDANNRAKIDEMVAMMKAHEEAHRSYIETAATAALAQAQALVGKRNKGAEALKILNNAECVANKQHEALDAKEGVFSVSDNAGVITITKSSSGAKYPCESESESKKKKKK